MEENAVCFAFIVLQMNFTIHVLWLLLRVWWVGLQSVIVVFPDQTHYIFSCHGIYGGCYQNKEF